MYLCNNCIRKHFPNGLVDAKPPVVTVPLLRSEIKEAREYGVRFENVVVDVSELKPKATKEQQAGEVFVRPVVDEAWNRWASKNLLSPSKAKKCRSNLATEGTRERAYWRARQDLLPTNKVSDNLSPDEVRFFEEFTKQYKVILVPRDRRNRWSTNDFIWHDMGEIACELKSNKATYGAIAEALRDAVEKSRLMDDRLRADGRLSENETIRKSNFIVNIGNVRLTEKLKSQLSHYNEKNDDNAVSRLWVWFRGKLVEITQEQET